MRNVVEILNQLNSQIAKLEKNFRNGKVSPGASFTIDVYYGGNKEVDFHRISIGGISDETQKANQLFHDLILGQLKFSRKFWVDVAEREVKQLNEILFETKSLNG